MKRTKTIHYIICGGIGAGFGSLVSAAFSTNNLMYYTGAVALFVAAILNIKCGPKDNKEDK